MTDSIHDLELEAAYLRAKVTAAKALVPSTQKLNLPKQPSEFEEEQLTLVEICDQLDQQIWEKEPDTWVEQKLGEFLWSRQKEICRAVVNHRHVAVPSCFTSGKSFIAARLAAWWIDIHEAGKAFVVTSATTGAQVKAILWRELHRAFNAGKLKGHLNQTEWWLPVESGDEEIVAFGRKPSEMNPTAFQGIHAPFVLVILDEAAGIPESLFEAADALISNENSRLLAIGNPEDATSHFKKVCDDPSWKVIRIPASVTPNFTEEDVPEELKEVLLSPVWVEEKRISWGEDSPMWQAKVLADFPSSQSGGLIPIAWIRAAQDNEIKPKPEDINELGVDVGGGGDKSIVAHRHSGRVRIIRADQNPDTMETCGNIIADLEETKATIAKIDEIGIGRGVVDRGKEQKKPMIGINVGSMPKDPTRFTNLRAEGYWELREKFQKGLVDLPTGPEGEEIVAQLTNLKYKRTSNGKIGMESKDEMKKRLKNGRSPDEADAIMLAFLDPPSPPKKMKGATWGR